MLACLSSFNRETMGEGGGTLTQHMNVVHTVRTSQYKGTPWVRTTHVMCTHDHTPSLMAVKGVPSSGFSLISFSATRQPITLDRRGGGGGGERKDEGGHGGGVEGRKGGWGGEEREEGVEERMRERVWRVRVKGVEGRISGCGGGVGEGGTRCLVVTGMRSYTQLTD